MTQLPPVSLNPLTLPLRGERLIEASAGTGKTFTIGLLYLRLLLGLGGGNAYSRPLSVEEILVVTFTEAATAELRAHPREYSSATSGLYPRQKQQSDAPVTAGADAGSESGRRAAAGCRAADG